MAPSRPLPEGGAAHGAASPVPIAPWKSSVRRATQPLPAVPLPGVTDRHPDRRADGIATLSAPAVSLSLPGIAQTCLAVGAERSDEGRARIRAAAHRTRGDGPVWPSSSAARATARQPARDRSRRGRRHTPHRRTKNGRGGGSQEGKVEEGGQKWTGDENFSADARGPSVSDLACAAVQHPGDDTPDRLPLSPRACRRSRTERLRVRPRPSPVTLTPSRAVARYSGVPSPLHCSQQRRGSRSQQAPCSRSASSRCRGFGRFAERRAASKVNLRGSV